jgi:hypothetical protein
LDQIRETVNKSHVPPASIQDHWPVGYAQAVHEESIALIPEILIGNFAGWASDASDVVLDLPAFPMMISKGMAHYDDLDDSMREETSVILYGTYE